MTNLQKHIYLYASRSIKILREATADSSGAVNIIIIMVLSSAVTILMILAIMVAILYLLDIPVG